MKFLLNENTELGEEGYTLTVSKSNIIISACKPAGIFYGIQSLLQLLPPEIKSKELQANVRWEIPAVEIKDKP
ncbi:MAG: glycoside hydrolase family 20 zincin-like fold domain-containing protein [Odoribacter sp.]|nr:glycoside hydrolase family 20 zincin-like fold domain-containing protein [Odoribacter sp.]